ncbi:MAG: hypothetical protein ABIK86_08475 [candidate division WOR-3 bacterium]
MERSPIRAVLTALVVCAALPASASGRLTSWGPETALTAPFDTAHLTGAPRQQKLVVSDNGEMHLFYAKPAHQFSQVFYKRYVPGASWLPDTCISLDVAHLWNTRPAVAIDPAGNLHVVWTEHGGMYVWYKMRNAAGVWDGASTRLSGVDPLINVGNPVIACSPDGHVHAAWLEYNSTRGMWFVYREKVGETWSPALVVDSVDTVSHGYFRDASIAVDGENRVHLVFIGSSSGGPRGGQVYYRCRTETAWGERERVSLGGDEATQTSAVVAVGLLAPEPQVVWAGDRPDTTSDCIWYSCRTGNAWLPPQLISDPLHRTEQTTPSVVFTRDGALHVAWFETAPAPSYAANLWYAERDTSGWWQPPAALTCDSVQRFWVRLADGGRSPDSSHVHLVWTDTRAGPYQVYYRRGSPSPHGIKWHDEVPSSTARERAVQATICRGVLRLAADASQPTVCGIGLLDISGRSVQVGMLESSNGRGLSLDVSCLAPGIYFVRFEASGLKTVSRVLLVR